MENNNHIQSLADSYDKTVDEYHQGIGEEEKLTDELKQSESYKELQKEGGVNSGLPEIKEFLAPENGMKFLDIGSCANLFTYNLYEWESEYYGVDISPKLVSAMRKVVEGKQVQIGDLIVADVASLPFKDSFFDISAVIGVLEYYDIAYIKQSLTELHRVLKNEARIVIDMLNFNHPYIETMIEAEKQQGRVYSRNLPGSKEFEDALEGQFEVKRVDDSRVMTLYFLEAVK